MTARAIMFQGTGSNVGKSILVAGLCRAAAKRGIRVAPFKPQNMSNNAAVCADGGEIGRAQALQARASDLEPHSDFNPVLIKPQSDMTAQLVVHGQVFATSHAKKYMTDTRASLLPYVMQSFNRLKSDHELILIEGAGSPAETNLRTGDIANMGFAVHANVPVCIIADIDRGGVIASLVGTRSVLDEADAGMINSFIVNKFRGDISLFQDGVRDITDRTNWWCAGVVPWLPEVSLLPPEDAVPLEEDASVLPTSRQIKVCVPILSRIANFDDIDPLRQEPGVHVVFVKPGEPIPLDADVVILPGTKSAIADMDFIRQHGWDTDIRALARAGRHIMGLCGGYQLLGQTITDKLGVDGPAGSRQGLGLLDVSTEMKPGKTLRHTTGTHLQSGTPLSGYEIHVGQTDRNRTSPPFAQLAHGLDGACNASGQICGTYLHGVFASDEFRRHWLNSVASGVASNLNFHNNVENALDQLAQSLESALDIDRLFASAR